VPDHRDLRLDPKFTRPAGRADVLGTITSVFFTASGIFDRLSREPARIPPFNLHSVGCGFDLSFRSGIIARKGVAEQWERSKRFALRGSPRK
ncbi:MAG: hypothetical protein L0387_40665, partial [Acidobacteria bacterium]|nr:hypothetical protein [Acidobacteriota bacterium]